MFAQQKVSGQSATHTDSFLNRSLQSHEHVLCIPVQSNLLRENGVYLTLACLCNEHPGKNPLCSEVYIDSLFLCLAMKKIVGTR